MAFWMSCSNGETDHLISEGMSILVVQHPIQRVEHVKNLATIMGI